MIASPPKKMSECPRPLPGRTFLSSLFNAMKVERKQGRGFRELESYLEANPAWFWRTRERIRAEGQESGLITLWHDEIKRHIKQGVWCVLRSVAHSANYTMGLRRELAKAFIQKPCVPNEILRWAREVIDRAN